MSKRRIFLRNLSLLVAGGLGSLSFKSKKMTEQTKTLKGPFIHMVFFWLKEPDNTEAREKFLLSLNRFIDEASMVQRKHIGTPANTSRPVIDSSYTFSLVLSFDSKADHDEYQAFQPHKQFIAESESLWERVQVYDSSLMS